jgi:hypothetical protein
MLLVYASDPVDQLADLRVLGFLSVVMAFLHRQQFPRQLILEIVQIFAGQWHFLSSLPILMVSLFEKKEGNMHGQCQNHGVS